MTSLHGNIFRITGPLCAKFTGHRWIPLTKASDAELWFFFLYLCLDKRLSEQSWDWWFETQFRSLRRHCNDLSLYTYYSIIWLSVYIHYASAYMHIYIIVVILCVTTLSHTTSISNYCSHCIAFPMRWAIFYLNGEAIAQRFHMIPWHLLCQNKLMQLGSVTAPSIITIYWIERHGILQTHKTSAGGLQGQ